MSVIATAGRRLRGEAGFTLIEMLVAAMVGMIVLFGLYDMVDRVLPASQRISDRVGTEQRGRVALEQVVREMRTAVCVQNGKDAQGRPTYLSPYQSAGPTQVTFYGGLVGQNDAFTPKLMQISYANQTLTEKSWNGTAPSGGNPYWTFPDPSSAAPTSTRTVLSSVALAQNATGPFTFQAYDPNAATPQLTAITPVNNAVPAASVPLIARVDIAFTVQPTKTTTYRGTDATFQDSVTTRVAADLSSSSEAAQGPQCQI